MKLDITKPSKQSVSDAKHTANMILPGLLDLSNSKPNLERSREKAKIKLTGSIKDSAKPEKPVSLLKQIDFNKWLNLSIGQREAIQSLLANLTQQPPAIDPIEKTENCLKKLKAKLDKCLTSLMIKKQITKQALLNHKKEVNKLFQEILA